MNSKHATMRDRAGTVLSPFVLPLLLCVLFSGQALATVVSEPRAVVIVLDDSRSMDPKDQDGRGELANYSIQTLISLLHPHDEVSVRLLNAGRLITSKRNAAMISTVRGHHKLYGNTPMEEVFHALDEVRDMKPRHKWVVVFTDGEFGRFSVKGDANDTKKLEKFNRAVQLQNGQEGHINLAFVRLGETSQDDNLRSLNQKLGGELYEAKTPKDVLAQIEKIGKIIGSRPLDTANLNQSISGKTLRLKSQFPLRRVTLVGHKKGTGNVFPEVSGGTALDVETFALKTPGKFTDVSHFQQEGRVYHIQSRDNNGIIPAGDIEIVWSGDVGGENLSILPEVAIDFVVEPQDAQGKALTQSNGVATACVGELLHAAIRFIDPKNPGQEITFDKSKLKLALRDKNKAETVKTDVDKMPFQVTAPGRETLGMSVTYPGYFHHKEALQLQAVDCVTLGARLSEIDAKGIPRRLAPSGPRYDAKTGRTVEAVLTFKKGSGTVSARHAAQLAKDVAVTYAGKPVTVVAKGGDYVAEFTVESGIQTLDISLSRPGVKGKQATFVVNGETHIGIQRGASTWESKPTKIGDKTFLFDLSMYPYPQDNEKADWSLTMNGPAFLKMQNGGIDARSVLGALPFWWTPCFCGEGGQPVDFTVTNGVTGQTHGFSIPFRILPENLFDRCWLFTIKILLSLLSLVYAYGLLTKPRFVAGAHINYWRPKARQSSLTKLSTGVLNRNLLPFKPERRVIEGQVFEASPSKGKVFVMHAALAQVKGRGDTVKINRIKQFDMNPKGKTPLSHGDAVEISRSGKVTKYEYKTS